MKLQKQAVSASELPAPNVPLSQGIVAGSFVFVSGQVPRDPITGSVPDGIEAQTRVVIANIDRVLQAAGSSLSDVVKVTAHLADLRDREGYNRIYREMFNEPFPARTTVGSQLDGMLVEIDAIAIRPGS